MAVSPLILPPSLNVASSAATGASVAHGTPAADAFDATVAGQFLSVSNDLHRTALFSTSVKDNLKAAADYSRTLVDTYKQAVEDITTKKDTRERIALQSGDDAGFIASFKEGVREGVREAIGEVDPQDRTFGPQSSSLPETFFSPLRDALREAVETVDTSEVTAATETSDEETAETILPPRKDRKKKGTPHPGYEESDLSDADPSLSEKHSTQKPKEFGPAPSSGRTFETWQDGSSWQNIRGYSSDRANQWLSEWGDKHKPEIGADGNYVNPASGAKWENQMSRVGKTQGVLSAAGEGGMAQGASSMLKGAGSSVAIAAAVALAVKQIYDVGMDETAKYHSERGRLRQSSRDGGTESIGDVVAERGRKFFKKNFSEEALFMGRDEAEGLNQGLTDMGLRGEGRRKGAEFALEQYKRSGMSSDTSLQLMQESMDGGVTDFTKLAEALDGVRNSAAKGSVTLAKAERDFADLYTTISRSTTTGEGAITLAGSISSMNNQLGQGLSDVDLSGTVTDKGAQYAYAQRTGQTIGEVQAAIEEGDKDVTSAMASAGTDRLAKAIFATAGGIESAAAKMKDYTDANAPFDSDEKKKALGVEAMRRGLYRKDSVVSIAKAMGVQIPDGDVSLFVGSMLANVADGKSAVDTSTPLQDADGGDFTDDQKGKIDGKEISKFGAFDRSVRWGDKGLGKGIGWVADKAMPFDENFERRKSLPTGITVAPGRQQHQEKALKGEFESHLKTKADQEAWDSYAGAARGPGEGDGGIVFQTGQRNKAVEKLFKSDLSEDTKFAVKHEDGKTKNVSFSEAISDYAEQLEEGDIEITSGNNKGKKVSEVTGISGKEGTDEEGKEGKDKKQNVNVMVSPTGSLARLLKFTVGGDGELDDSRSAGEPPSGLTKPFNLPGWVL